MEKVMSESIAIYPGCSLEGTENAFFESLKKVLGVLGDDKAVLDDWNCCGATSAHALDHTLYLSLAVRNLEHAENQGYGGLLAPCAACYHRLANANFQLRSEPGLLSRINKETGLNYSGNVRVLNVLDFFANITAAGKIARHVVRPLTGLKAACYYGCLNTRIPRMEPFDDVEHPSSMDRILKSIGARPLEWSSGTDCCGASLFVTSEATSLRLVSRILKDAVSRGADCIAVSCPMCHNNLDSLQDDIRAKYGISRPIPVVFITQLMGLAFGVPESEMKLDHNFVPFALTESGTP